MMKNMTTLIAYELHTFRNSQIEHTYHYILTMLLMNE